MPHSRGKKEEDINVSLSPYRWISHEQEI